MVTNLTSGGTAEQIAYCVQAGVIRPLCDMLGVKEAKVVIVILEAIANVLAVRGAPSADLNLPPFNRGLIYLALLDFDVYSGRNLV